MNRIDRFALESHEGPYETWPERSRLIVDGTPTEISLPGCRLLHQFETSSAYVLITDYDCPFEEMTNFVLLSKDLRVLSCRWVGAPYASFVLQNVEWVDEHQFTAVFIGDERLRYRFTIRSWGIPYLCPRLKRQRLARVR